MSAPAVSRGPWGVLLWKEGTEQRRALLAALSALLALFGLALATALLRGRLEGSAAWVAAWARRTFPLLLFQGLLPVYAAAAGALPFVRERAGTEDFLLSLPVRRRTLFGAKLLVSLGSVALLAAVAWGLEGILWVLAGRPQGPLPFPLQGMGQAALSTLVATLPFLAAGALAGTLARTPLGGLVGGIASAAVLLWLLVPAVAATQAFGWWVPPWAVLCLAGAVLLATGALALFERTEGPFPSTGHYALGGVVALLLASIGVSWGMALSLRPGEARRVAPIAVSSDGGAVAVEPVGAPRLWLLTAKGSGAHPLPGLRLRLLGFALDGRRGLLIRLGPWGSGATLVAFTVAGEVRDLMPLAPGPWEDAPGLALWSPAGDALFLDPFRKKLWLVPPDGAPEPFPGALPPDARILGWWGEEILLATRTGIEALDPRREGPARLIAAGVAEAWPLRAGRFLAFRPSPGALAVHEEGRGAPVPIGGAVADPPVWVQHLETLYYRDGDWLAAWHAEVGVRPLQEGVTAFRVLPDGNRILVALRGGGIQLLHAGTRSLRPLLLPPNAPLLDPDLAAPSPDGEAVAFLQDRSLWMLSLREGEGEARRARELPGASWVAWAGPDRLWLRTGPADYALLALGKDELRPILRR